MSKAPKLHNAMWPGLVGKGTDEGQEPPISLERMLDLTAAAEVNGQKFDGIDYFLFLPHTDPSASDDELKKIADQIQNKGFDIGSLVAPVWPGTIGDSAMGSDEQQAKFLEAVKMGCRVAKIFNEHGDAYKFFGAKGNEDMCQKAAASGYDSLQFIKHKDKANYAGGWAVLTVIEDHKNDNTS